jgi:hypothetical protein
MDLNLMVVHIICYGNQLSKLLGMPLVVLLQVVARGKSIFQHINGEEASYPEEDLQEN